MSKRAVLYARVAVGDADGANHKLVEQLAQCRNYALAQGWSWQQCGEWVCQALASRLFQCHCEINRDFALRDSGNKRFVIVRLTDRRQQQVNRYRLRPCSGDGGQEPGLQRARPGPGTQCVEAAVVDFYQDHVGAGMGGVEPCPGIVEQVIGTGADLPGKHGPDCRGQ